MKIIEERTEKHYRAGIVIFSFNKIINWIYTDFKIELFGIDNVKPSLIKTAYKNLEKHIKT